MRRNVATLLSSVRVIALATISGCGFTIGASSVPLFDAAMGDATSPVIDAIDAAGSGSIDAPPGAPQTVNVPITQDTNVDSFRPTTTFGSDQAVLVDGPPDTAVILMRAELSQIPLTATVEVAELHIWTSQTLGDNMSIYEMLESWNEATAVWGLRATSSPWSGIGASPPSRGTIVRGAIPAPTMQYTQTVVMLDLTPVAGWVAQPTTNFGFAITTTGSNGTGFRSREDATQTRRPFLRIRYRL